MNDSKLTVATKKEIINRWFGSNDSANTIAQDMQITVGEVINVIQESRKLKPKEPLITDDKIPFDAV